MVVDSQSLAVVLATDATPGAVAFAPPTRGMTAATAAYEAAQAQTTAEEEARRSEAFFNMLGPLRALLDDESVLNIDVNGDGVVWFERWGKRKERLPQPMADGKRRALIGYLANLNGGAMDSLHSRLQCDLPVYGSRVQAKAPPISNWTLAIRVHSKHVPTLESYGKNEIATWDQIAIFKMAIEHELSITIGGNVNTGKTTLMNAFLEYKARIHSHYRAVVVQDRREVRVDGFPDHDIIMARVDQAHHESNGTVSRYTYEFSDALEDALRSNGKFLVWGEVRDGFSAFALTLAMNSGASGLITTTHATGAAGIPPKIEALIELNGKTPQKRLIANFADLLVFMDFDPRTETRRVTQVAVLEETEDGYEVKMISTVRGLQAYLDRRRARAIAAAEAGEQTEDGAAEEEGAA